MRIRLAYPPPGVKKSTKIWISNRATVAQEQEKSISEGRVTAMHPQDLYKYCYICCCKGV